MTPGIAAIHTFRAFAQQAPSAVLVLLVSSIVACGTNNPAGNNTDDDAVSLDSATGDTTPNDITAFDSNTDAELDSGPDLDSNDADGSTTTDAENDTEDDASNGDPCSSNDDCDDLQCFFVFPDSDQGVCASPCATDNDCPRNADCILLVSSGADAVNICLPQQLCLDTDNDDYGVGPGCLGRDCDDLNEFRNPGTAEVCDGLDNNCNEIIDDSPSDTGRPCDTGIAGECSDGLTACTGGALNCDAIAAAVPERCDERDNDCDGLTDEGEDGLPLTRTCYDGPAETRDVGTCRAGRQTCEAGGFSSCLDQALPQTEVCDLADNDCDGSIDENIEQRTWYQDLDNDTWGNSNAPTITACRRPEGYVERGDDCDDNNTSVRPGATDAPGDNVDSNCDGSELCFIDSDNDGYRANGSAVAFSANTSCLDDGEATATDPTGDCDDNDPNAYPGNPETCDNADNNCNARIDEASACYLNGQTCLDDADCRSNICTDTVCMAPLTCQDRGTCPPITSITGGGDRQSPSYRLRTTVGEPVASPPLHSPRYTLQIGPITGLSR
jgi:hypothetical protein